MYGGADYEAIGYLPILHGDPTAIFILGGLPMASAIRTATHSNQQQEEIMWTWIVFLLFKWNAIKLLIDKSLIPYVMLKFDLEV